jgi:threonine dehydrogenase-like Zn-dependent dehydrogenase
VGGGFGDTFITPASTLVAVPDGLTDDQAIMTEPVAVALHAAWRRKPQPEEQVLVLGCGTIGFLLIQIVRLLQPDCQVTAVAQFPWQAEMAREFGAEHTFLATDDGFSQVAGITGARIYGHRARNRMLMGGLDLIFDVVGAAATLNHSLRWARAGGTVVLVGVHLHHMKMDVTPVWYQEVDLIGAVGHDVVTWQGERLSAFDLAMRWMGSGEIDGHGLVTHHYPLDAYRRAFEAAIDKERNRSIKVVFDLKEGGSQRP